MFLIYHTIPVDNELSICQLVNFGISYLGLNDTSCWCIFLYSCKWAVLKLADQGGWIMRTQGGCWVVCCHRWFVFYESILHDPYSFWINGPSGIVMYLEADGHFAMTCMVHIYNWLLLTVFHQFYRRNTFGHVGITSFMYEFSKPQSLETKIKINLGTSNHVTCAGTWNGKKSIG